MLEHISQHARTNGTVKLDERIGIIIEGGAKNIIECERLSEYCQKKGFEINDIKAAIVMRIDLSR